MSNINIIKKCLEEILCLKTEFTLGKYIKDWLKGEKIDFRTDKAGNIVVGFSGRGERVLLSAPFRLPESCSSDYSEKVGAVAGQGLPIGLETKASVSLLLALCEYLKTNKFKHRPFEIVFAKNLQSLDWKKISSKTAIALKLGESPASIQLTSPFIYKLEISVSIKSDKKSLQSGQGAMIIALKALSQIDLGKLNASNFIDVLYIKNMEDNHLADQVSLETECFGFRQESVLKQIDKLNRIFKKEVRKSSAKLIFKSLVKHYAYNFKKSDKLIKHLAFASKETRSRSVFYKSFYAGDANVYNKKGLESVHLSLGGRFPHTAKESVKFDDLDKTFCFLLEFLR